MSNQQTIIIAHSLHQYEKCQKYLKGEKPITSMYPLMVTYYNEIRAMYRDIDFNLISDEEIAERFSLNLKPPGYEK